MEQFILTEKPYYRNERKLLYHFAKPNHNYDQTFRSQSKHHGGNLKT